MNYDLAKQLKDAGFPLKYPAWQYERAWNKPENEWGADYAYVPTLSELIAACGTKFGILERDKNTGVWYCVSDIEGDRKTVAEGSYSAAETPEEAVATLWLALNKKP